MFQYRFPLSIAFTAFCKSRFEWSRRNQTISKCTINCSGKICVFNVFSIILFQDGGLLINNPSALALHECKCLWPGVPLQCVISLGTGRYEGVVSSTATHTSLKAKLTNVISSATDTEGEHFFSSISFHSHWLYMFLLVSHVCCKGWTVKITKKRHMSINCQFRLINYYLH